MKEALYYRHEGNACRCLLCPYECLIEDGRYGRCRARAASGGRLYAMSYGAASALALDPIEKKPLYRFHPGSHILSYGSYGCNMDCAWCQNSSISQRQAPPDAVHVTPESLVRTAVEIAQETQQEIGGKYARDRTAHQPPGNIGVAFTYNEPLISPELIMDTAPLLRAAGLSVVLVTNAMVNEAPFMNILPHIDAMNIDLKSFHQGLYERNGGDTRTVMRNIETAAAAGCHIEITTLIIPGENDTEDGIRAEAEWLAGIDPGIPLHITRFFPRYRMTGKTPTPARTMERLAAVAKRHLRHVYLGNIRI